ncbi:ABC transporter ATP-binding protein [Eubacterium coprostanoligenes]|uniref:ABC transporter ATP-binding protein n=1 Tax=Eubacterium coprostanoligenes TaxID=290054 RepID=UPI002353A620|nr:ABC transporter ATP-binding protein [Eubacterium coprostanoligenes]MCI6253497.1 ABC transporter ATP-binding protein/permease [Eubacterium coprostanoligenes]MDD7357461.1 ABC transporter ATP-binding protein [Eubacterium coprostanoligenes]MDY5400138.1 ABC transporter ATP-binding protein [Eubacterium coprostanoligenes]
MIKKLSKYLKGLGWLCVASALGMIVEAMCELALPSVANSVYEMVKTSTGDPADLKLKIGKIGLLMLIMAIVGFCGGLMTMKTSSVASQKFSYRLRKAMYDKISSFSFKNIDTFSTSSLTTRLTNDVTMLQNTLMMGLRILVRAPALLIVSAVFAFSINAKLSMILLVLFPVMIVIIAVILKFGFPMFQKMQKKIDNINRVVQENLIGIRVVKAYVREDREKDKFHEASDDLANQGSKASGLIITVMPIMMLLMNFVIIYIYYKGSIDASNKLMDVGQISVLANYIVQVLMNIMMVSMLMLQLTRAKACGDRVVEVLDTEIDIVNPENPFKPTEPKGEVEFKNVSFGYNDGMDILTDVSFKAKAGSVVGIIGSTGCGKSSLVNLIPRLYDVSGGEILVDGVNVKDYDIEALRELIGVVLQKNVLFTGTIKENIKWGKQDATDEEIISACKAAQAHDFIMSQPDGYDTELSQGGLNLSGGQKQRLCIARAIIKQPKILILDDSTSAVDTATEAKIRECFYKELKDTTVLIIAQRISSVAQADEIIVLDDGKIDSVGNHEELMQTSEIYQEIYKTQQKGVME